MKNPKQIDTVVNKAVYIIPTFQVTDNGLEDAEPYSLQFCKGNKDDRETLRLTGFLTETLISVSKRYLEENNVGELSTRETSMAITKLDEALMWLQRRGEDRLARGVQGTYQK